MSRKVETHQVLQNNQGKLFKNKNKNNQIKLKSYQTKTRKKVRMN